MQEEGNTSLDNILNDEPTEAVETPEVEAAPEPTPEPEEAPDGPVRDELGRFAPKQPETGVEDTAPPADKLPKEDYKAIREEREKRQALQAELETLRQTVQSLQQPQEPPAPPPSMWEDEQGWQQHFGAQVAQQAALNAKLDLSEMLTRKENSADFDDMKARFLQMAEANPAIVQQALGDPDPWGKAYKIAKNAATMEDLGATDLDTLKAKIREELMAEMQAQAPVPQQTPLPPSLTGERNLGSRSGPAWTGPKPLEDLLR